MNERIRELAERAGAWKYYEINEGADGDEKPLKKFAELIVKECAEIADDGYGSDHFGNGIAGYQLLKHFGIEE